MSLRNASDLTQRKTDQVKYFDYSRLRAAATQGALGKVLTYRDFVDVINGAVLQFDNTGNVLGCYTCPSHTVHTSVYNTPLLRYVSPYIFFRRSPINLISPTISSGPIQTYNITNLPSGLSYDILTGIISGTPTTLIANNLAIATGNNSEGSSSANINFTIIDETSGVFRSSFGANISYNHSTVDSKGNIYITGGDQYRTTGLGFYNSNNLTPIYKTHPSLSISSDYSCLAKFNSNGIFQYVNYIAGPGWSSGYRVATDSKDNVYMLGYYYAELNSRLSSNNIIVYTNNMSNQRSNIISTPYSNLENLYLSKFNSNGNFIWANSIGDVSIPNTNYFTGSSTSYYGDTIGTLDIDSYDNVYFSFRILDPVRYSNMIYYNSNLSSSLSNIIPRVNTSLYRIGYINETVCIKVSSNGNFINAQTFQNYMTNNISNTPFANRNLLSAIDFDSLNNRYYTGYYSQQSTLFTSILYSNYTDYTTNIVPTIGNYFVSPSNAVRAMVIKTNSNAGYTWAFVIRSSSESIAYDITINNINNIYVTGTYTDYNNDTYIVNADATSNINILKQTSNLGAYIFKLNTNGILQNSVCLASDNYISSTTIELDINNNIFISGNYNGTSNNILVYTSNLNGPIYSNILPTPTSGYSGKYVMTFDSNLNYLYSLCVDKGSSVFREGDTVNLSISKNNRQLNLTGLGNSGTTKVYNQNNTSYNNLILPGATQVVQYTI